MIQRPSYFQLSPIERHLTNQAIRQLVQTRMALWLAPLRFAVKHLRRDVRAQKSGATLNQLVTLFKTACSFFPQSSVTEALAAQRFLARHGYRAEIHLARSTSKAIVYGWLSYRGHVILGSVPRSHDYTLLE